MLPAERLVSMLVLAGTFWGVCHAKAAAQREAPHVLSPPREEGPVVVRTSFTLLGINDIDDDAEVFDFHGVMKLTWRDPRSAFDPALEGVDEKLYQGSFQFNEMAPAWFPQVMLVNAAGTFERQGEVLRVQADGTSVLMFGVLGAAKAHLNLRRYPFDRHWLRAVFEVLGMDSTEVLLQAEPGSTATNGRDIRVPEWTLESVSVSSAERSAPYAGRSGTASSFVLSMEVARDSFFVVRLILIPLVVIVILSWSVFWMERSSLADRISVSFIGILTAVAYQLVVTDIQPDISYMTLLHGILNLSFLIMCATVVVNLRVGQLDKQGMSDAGDRIDHRCRWIFPAVYFGLISVIAFVAFVFF